MVIKKNSVVELVYKMESASGVMLEERTPEMPAVIICGHGQILPYIEQALMGLKTGATLDLDVPSAKAFGSFVKELITEADRSQFSQAEPLSIGMRFRTKTPDGNEMIVNVIELRDETVILDGNHPLAGQDLQVHLRVLSVRDASQDEIDGQTPVQFDPKKTH